jgi:hypothetical protein
MARQYIDKTLLTDYRIVTYDGVDLISRYPLLTALIKNTLGAKFANLLAEPVRKSNNNELNWYSSVEGEPLGLEELSEEQKKQLLNEKDSLVADLKQFASQLEASKGGSRTLAGILLNLILKEQDGFRLYSIAGQPVLIGWGLSALSSGYNTDSVAQRSEDPNLQDTVAPVTSEASSEPSPEVTLESLSAEVSASPVSAQRYNKKSSQDKKRFSRTKSTIKAEKITFFQKIGTIGIFLVGLGSLLFLILLSYLFFILFFASGRPLAIPQWAIDANDVSFMEGCWNSTSDHIVNIETELPITYTYCFDSGGNGSVTIDEYDAAGNYLDTCTSGAKVSFKDKNLVINVDKTVRCVLSGDGYVPHSVLCRSDSSDIFCEVTQEGISEIVEFNVTKK